MWDSDFEEFHVPDHIIQSSQTVKREGEAAIELAGVIGQLKLLLIARDVPTAPADAEVNAVALVHASLHDDSDEFYSCTAWKNCKNQALHVNGDSFGDVLACAKQYLAELSAGPTPLSI